MSRPWDDLGRIAMAALSSGERQAAALYLDERTIPAGDAIVLDGHELRRDHAVAVAFVDLEPAVNWGHRCRYLLIEPGSGAIERVEARYPPFLRGASPTLRLLWHGAAVPAWALVIPPS